MSKFVLGLFRCGQLLNDPVTGMSAETRGFGRLQFAQCDTVVATGQIDCLFDVEVRSLPRRVEKTNKAVATYFESEVFGHAV